MEKPNIKNKLHKSTIIRFTLLFSLILLILGSTSLVSVPSVNGSGDEESYLFSKQFRMEEKTARFYITNLTVGETWSLNLTALYEGTFYIYIFEIRPKQEYIDVKAQGTEIIDPEIRELSVFYNETPVEIFSANINKTVNNVQLNYNSTANKLHYVEIILVSGGPDTFVLTSNQLIEDYHVPFIPGFPYEILGSIIMISTVFIYKRMQKSAVSLK